MTPFPYQDQGSTRLVHARRIILADDPGLGKTAQALLAWRRLCLAPDSPGDSNTPPAGSSLAKQGWLVICPASLKINWQREAEMWLGDTEPALCPRPVVLSYDEARLAALGEGRASYIPVLSKVWGAFVADESHAFRSLGSKRTKLLLYGSNIKDPLTKKMRPHTGIRSFYCWFLTGTPMLNRPIELYSSLRHLNPHQWASRSHFEEYYCNAHMGKWGWDVSGAKHLDELKRIMFDGNTTRNGEAVFRWLPIMLRRTKAEVLPQLPEKRRQIIEITLPKEDETASKSLTTRLHGWDDAIESLGRLAKGPAAAEIAVLRRELGVAKAKVLAPLILERVAFGGEPLVIFGHHREAIEILRSTFEQAQVPISLIIGETNPAQRQVEVDRFQKGETKACLCSIQAAGVGLTLTRSDTCIIFEADWTPAINEQAESRLHRIGQKNAVLVEYYAVAESVDTRILRALLRKSSVISEVFS